MLKVGTLLTIIVEMIYYQSFRHGINLWSCSPHPLPLLPSLISYLPKLLLGCSATLPYQIFFFFAYTGLFRSLLRYITRFT